MNKVSLIITENIWKKLEFLDSRFYTNYNVKNDENAFDKFKENLNDWVLYNVIISGHKTTEDAYKLLNSFLDYNKNNDYIFENANYPFFMFFKNEKFDKKELYSYYLTNDKEREDPEQYKIDSKLLIFSRNEERDIREKLLYPFNYYNQKNLEVNNNPYYSPLIKIMYVGISGIGKSTLLNQLNGEIYLTLHLKIKRKLKTKKRERLFYLRIKNILF